MIAAWILLTAPAFVPAKTYVHASGKRIDCTQVRALPPGEVMDYVTQRLPRDPDALFGALGTCLAEGPHVCDRAWVGWAVFGGFSMAVVDGGAPPIERRRAAFLKACKALPENDQRCAQLSTKAPQCKPIRQTLRKALSTVR